LLAKNFRIKKWSAEVKISNLINYSVVYCQNDKNIRIVRGEKKNQNQKFCVTSITSNFCLHHSCDALEKELQMMNKTKSYNKKTRKTSLFIYEIEVWDETKIKNRFPTSQNLSWENNNMDLINVLPKQIPMKHGHWNQLKSILIILKKLHIVMTSVGQI